MASSIYDDKLITPTNKMLEVDLLNTKSYLDDIASFIETSYGNVKPEWKFYNKKSGWILKLFNKKRNVLFVVPCQGFFKAVFTFGEKTSRLVLENSKIPKSIKNDLSNAKKYVEGKTIQIEVKNEADFNSIIALVKLKLS